MGHREGERLRPYTAKKLLTHRGAKGEKGRGFPKPLSSSSFFREMGEGKNRCTKRHGRGKTVGDVNSDLKMTKRENIH